jgi:hypothetical protein
MHRFAGYLTKRYKTLILLISPPLGIKPHGPHRLLLLYLLAANLSVPHTQATMAYPQTTSRTADYGQIIRKLKHYSQQQEVKALNNAYIDFSHQGKAYRFHFTNIESHPPSKQGFPGCLIKINSLYCEQATLSIATSNLSSSLLQWPSVLKIVSTDADYENNALFIHKSNLINFYGLFEPDSKDKNLVINLFLHDDIIEAGITIDQIKRDHIDWWEEHLKDINRKNHYQLFRKLIVRFHKNPSIQSFNYQSLNSASKSLKHFLVLASQFRGIDSFKQLKAQTDHHQKFFLLTLHPLENGDKKVGGIAFTKGPYGIASIAGYQHLAHELGHSLGTSHENANIQYNGWWCETITYPYRHYLRSNCYFYTPLNQTKIADYLRQHPFTMEP